MIQNSFFFSFSENITKNKNKLKIFYEIFENIKTSKLNCRSIIDYFYILNFWHFNKVIWCNFKKYKNHLLSLLIFLKIFFWFSWNFHVRYIYLYVTIESKCELIDMRISFKFLGMFFFFFCYSVDFKCYFISNTR